MSSSLDKLVSNLPDDKFKYTSEVFKKSEKLNLMKRKGIYPYDYMSSFEKFDDKQLPSKEDFYSILNNEHISDEDYEHAQNIWKTFNLKAMGEDHDLYLKSEFFFQMYLRISERLVCNITNSILLIISHLWVYHGMLY